MAPVYRPVTLRMLLTHRAGLPPFTSDADFASARAYAGEGPKAREEFLPVLLGKPPDKEPGTETRYSNADFIVAAAMLERAANRSWRELVEQRVFSPLAIRGAFRGFPPPTSVHAGGNGEYYALVAIQPTRDLAVALLTNDGRDETEEWCAALLKELMAARAAPGKP
ncbi:MAG TPA: serine hydrolase domain-containing protein [Thermoanaerobaculia bacterium]|nr:serine hydrolase domain-containing protein [Thermoanaerobaculia bacterium]